MLDSVVSRLGELQTGARQVDTWIGATLNALKHDRSADRDHKSLKNRVEGTSPLFHTVQPPSECVTDRQTDGRIAASLNAPLHRREA